MECNRPLSTRERSPELRLLQDGAHGLSPRPLGRATASQGGGEDSRRRTFFFFLFFKECSRFSLRTLRPSSSAGPCGALPAALAFFIYVMRPRRARMRSQSAAILVFESVKLSSCEVVLAGKSLGRAGAGWQGVEGRVRVAAGVRGRGRRRHGRRGREKRQGIRGPPTKPRQTLFWFAGISRPRSRRRPREGGCRPRPRGKGGGGRGEGGGRRVSG